MAERPPTVADRDNARAAVERASRGVAIVALRLRLDAANMALPGRARCETIAARMVREPLGSLLPGEDAD